MPHIVFRNLEKEKFELIAEQLKESLYKTIDCPIDKVTFSLIETSTIIANKNSDEFCYVDISYFERPMEVQDYVAATIDNLLRKNDKENIAINFNYFNKDSYYDNMNKRK